MAAEASTLWTIREYIEKCQSNDTEVDIWASNRGSMIKGVFRCFFEEDDDNYAMIKVTLPSHIANVAPYLFEWDPQRQRFELTFWTYLRFPALEPKDEDGPDHM